MTVCTAAENTLATQAENVASAPAESRHEKLFNAAISIGGLVQRECLRWEQALDTLVRAGVEAGHDNGDRKHIARDVRDGLVIGMQKGPGASHLEFCGLRAKTTSNGARPKVPTAEADDPREFTDIGNGDRLARLHQPQLRYVRLFGTWYVWDGTHWQEDPKGVLVAALAKGISRDLYQKAAEMAASGIDPKRVAAVANWAHQSTGRHRVDAAIWMARNIDGILIEHEEIDSDPWALNVANGWIDLRSGTFHPPDPDKLLTLQSPVAWDPDATAPLWEKSLAQWLPEANDRDYFQRLCGASIVGDIKDHVLILIWGPGGNGKGTAIGTLARILGDYFVVPHKSLLVQLQHEQHATVKASLFRKRLAVAAETQNRIALNESQIKELTGGDQLSARRLYENEWRFWPTHTLWLQTNHLPSITGRDQGIWRRIKVLPWLATFTGSAEDRDLSEKLAGEASGILRWLVEGVIRWRDVGLVEPDTVTNATAEYRKAEDHIARWMTDVGLAIAEGLTISSAELTGSWKTWTETTFGKARWFNDVAAELEKQGCTKYVSIDRDDNNKQRRVTMWQGVGWSLLTPVDPSSGKSPYEEPLGESMGNGVHRGQQPDLDLDLDDFDLGFELVDDPGEVDPW